jgi:hypothetical protein
VGEDGAVGNCANSRAIRYDLRAVADIVIGYILLYLLQLYIIHADKGEVGVSGKNIDTSSFPFFISNRVS